MDNRDRPGADARGPAGQPLLDGTDLADGANPGRTNAASGGPVRDRLSRVGRRRRMPWLLPAIVLAFLPAPAEAAMPACHLFDRTAWTSCIYDGATGWEGGLQWRLAGFESPRIDAGSAGCHAEQIQGIKARDRLRALMARGYTITDTARRDKEQVRLVRLMLPDGRNAGIELLSQGLVQAVPNTGNRWCGK